ncbi:hypothetical protein Dimus_018289, partial [Dionaea muscipula]
PIPPIHGQFEQAVRSILDGMDRQNEGIKELFELLESKTITDNQKERLTMGHLKEAKSYLENITEQIRLLKIALKRTIMDVADLIFEKIKDQTTIVKTHCELMELKTENSNMELKH